MTESVNLDAMMVTNNDWEDDDEQDTVEEVVEIKSENPTANGQKVKVMAKKTPRKLPLFMQRPIPETDADVTMENFRIFIKWALTLIQNNPKLTAFGAPKFVAVNIPKELQFIIDSTNVEEVENGIPFVRFDGADDNEDLARNLELFGGLYGNNWHSSAKF